MNTTVQQCLGVRTLIQQDRWKQY